MEDKQKRKLHFNIVDGLILLLAAAVGVGVLALRNHATGEDVEHETVPMRYTVEFTSSPVHMEETIPLGGEAYSSVTGDYLGIIVDVRSKPHEVVQYSETLGRYVRYDIEDSRDVYMVIENEGYCTEKEVVIGKTTVRLGTEVAVKGLGFARTGYVYNVDTMGVPIPENTDEANGDADAEYVICFFDTRDMVLDQIHVGDHLYERWSGAKLGVVQSVEVKPCEETHLMPDGTTALVEKTGRRSIYVTVKGRCVLSKNGYYMDGKAEIKIGASVSVLSPYLDRSGTFYEVLSVTQ